MARPTLEEVIEYIRIEAGPYLSWRLKVFTPEVSKETQIEADLGIYGDDIDDFFADIEERFDVQLPQDLGISTQPDSAIFNNEGGLRLPRALRKYFGSDKKVRDMTVGEVYRAICIGYDRKE